MTKEIIQEILELAVNAPSGNNSQPWRFVASEGKVCIWNIPNRDKFLFNYQQRGSLIAHGALIENILIISSQKGYEGSIILFPNENEKDLIAEISFKESGIKYKYSHLYPFTLKRTTNRKPYKKTSLEQEDEKKLKEFCDSIKDSEPNVLLKQDIESIDKLSKYFSVADRLIFENFDIHEAFFKKVSWTRKEEEKKREGLYVGTKELSPAMRFIFKYVFSNWNALKFLSKLKISIRAAAKREKLYANCSAIGLIVAEGDSPKDFIATGRILQLFWLTVTSLDLSFQPVSAGLLYIGQRMQKETPKEFTSNQAEFIRDAYKNILEIFNDLRLVPTFSFRIGYSNPPTASSLKKPPEIIWN